MTTTAPSGNAPLAQRLPRIAITIGDPAGIGPEVVARAVLSPAVRAQCTPVIYGTGAVMDAAIRLVAGLEQGCGADIGWSRDGIEMVEVAGPAPGDFAPGQIDGRCGMASFAYLEAAALDTLAGRCDALATAPINKESTARGGFADVGHLEYLTRMTKTRESGTVLVAGHLRCLHLTTHKSLGDAVLAVTTERILAKLRLGHASMRRFGVTEPKIAVAALNPHGGEGGLFGREEIEAIGPAVAAARAEGIDAHGPLPADSLLPAATSGRWDLVLVLYHDQGHIAVKVHDFHHSYTVAFGLPLVRTSVDHGTAFDVAWQGKADARSMIAAILAAAHLARGRWPAPAEVRLAGDR